MKNVFKQLVPMALLAACLTGSASAQTKVATIDLRKLFDNYWKTKQADAALKDRATDLDKEDKNLRDDLKKANDDYQKMLIEASDQALSSEKRDERKLAAEKKLKDVKDTVDTIDQFERQARTTLAEQKRRTTDNLVAEIRIAITAKAKAGGFALVVDSAAESANGTPILLFTNGDNDLTADVLKELNAASPIETPKPAEKTEPKKDEKK